MLCYPLEGRTNNSVQKPVCTGPVCSSAQLPSSCRGNADLPLLFMYCRHGAALKLRRPDSAARARLYDHLKIGKFKFDYLYDASESHVVYGGMCIHITECRFPNGQQSTCWCLSRCTSYKCPVTPMKHLCWAGKDVAGKQCTGSCSRRQHMHLSSALHVEYNNTW
jgi:hypothetical protein